MALTRRRSRLDIHEVVKLIAATTSMKWSTFIVHKNTLKFFQVISEKISGRHENTDNPCAVFAVVIIERPATNARRSRASFSYSAV
jgi:hypothetical protein